MSDIALLSPTYDGGWSAGGADFCLNQDLQDYGIFRIRHRDREVAPTEEGEILAEARRTREVCLHKLESLCNKERAS